MAFELHTNGMMRLSISLVVAVLLNCFPLPTQAEDSQKNNSVLLQPIVWPLFMQYYDIQGSVEKEYLQNQSIGVGGVFNYKDFPDSSIPGRAHSLGVVVFHRSYFTVAGMKSRFFVMPSLEISKAKVMNRVGFGSDNQGTLVDLKLLLGLRNYFQSEQLFYEFGAGAYYRTRGLSTGGFAGYRQGFLPALLFSLGYAFQ